MHVCLCTLHLCNSTDSKIFSHLNMLHYYLLILLKSSAWFSLYRYQYFVKKLPIQTVTSSFPTVSVLFFHPPHLSASGRVQTLKPTVFTPGPSLLVGSWFFSLLLIMGKPTYVRWSAPCCYKWDNAATLTFTSRHRPSTKVLQYKLIRERSAYVFVHGKTKLHLLS